MKAFAVSCMELFNYIIIYYIAQPLNKLIFPTEVLLDIFRNQNEPKMRHSEPKKVF